MPAKPPSDRDMNNPDRLGVGDRVRRKDGREGEVVFIDAKHVTALVRIFGPQGAAIVGDALANLRRIDDDAPP
jgi:hypothetical protein